MENKLEPRLKRTKDKFQAFSDYPLVVGTILEEYNQIEKKIDQVIITYFKPSQNIDLFEKVMLNSSVLGIGQKCKILANIKGFDNRALDNIRRISSIRNGIAHSNATPVFYINVNSEMRVEKVNQVNTISVMNSNGKVVERQLEIMYDEFASIEHELSPYLSSFVKKLKSN